jgi:hypothetical protein
VSASDPGASLRGHASVASPSPRQGQAAGGRRYVSAGWRAFACVRLIQIRHQHGRIILSRDGIVSAEQLAGSRDREPFLMSEAADYLVVEHLRDGRPIEIRALRPNDRDEILVAIGRISTQSIQRRFFAPSAATDLS